jgi:hypothetical protein
MLIVATSFLFDFIMVATFDLVLVLTLLEVVTWNTSNRVINFHF